MSARGAAQPEFPAIIEEAIRRGYLSITENQITYKCRRNYRTQFGDPEEKVRAITYSWLIIERSYSPERIDIEVRVPRRTPNDFADIVVYRDDACKEPFLVVENKQERATTAEQRQAIEQGFGNANSLRASYMLFDYGRGSAFFDCANFPAGERAQNKLVGCPQVTCSMESSSYIYGEDGSLTPDPDRKRRTPRLSA